MSRHFLNIFQWSDIAPYFILTQLITASILILIVSLFYRLFSEISHFKSTMSDWRVPGQNCHTIDSNVWLIGNRQVVCHSALTKNYKKHFCDVRDQISAPERHWTLCQMTAQKLQEISYYLEYMHTSLLSYMQIRVPDLVDKTRQQLYGIWRYTVYCKQT